ncbi:MAG: hypothetical protein K2I13_05050, partial [Alistipes sp.]|nr:hypothetical protein [Alistipes sp.]
MRLFPSCGRRRLGTRPGPFDGICTKFTKVGQFIFPAKHFRTIFRFFVLQAAGRKSQRLFLLGSGREQHPPYKNRILRNAATLIQIAALIACILYTYDAADDIT